MYKLFENEYICNSINNANVYPYFQSYDEVLEIENINNVDFNNIYMYLNREVLYIYTEENVRGMEEDLIRYVYNELEEIEYISE